MIIKANNKSIYQAGLTLLVLSLTACNGKPMDGTSSSSSSSSGKPSSSSSSSSSSSGVPANPGFATLHNGKGQANFEPVLMSAQFNKAASLAAFKTTVYPYLIKNGCAGCHSSDIAEAAGGQQAPLIADADVGLAHEYALSYVNFKQPAASKLVEELKIYRHHCSISTLGVDNTTCASSASSLLSTVQAWSDSVASILPTTPGSSVSAVGEDVVAGWIKNDKTKVAATEQKYMVYVSLNELYNDGLSADQINVVRVAISKALNSTARWAPKIINPIDINGKGFVYRFDIRDYWGFNQGVSELLFGGSDDDIAFGNGKKDYKGNTVATSIQQKRYNFTGKTVTDPAHALRIWERVLHGNVEGASTSGVLPANIDGFKGTRKTNAAGQYADINALEWVEASQLVYTLTRPDVYNAIMMNPFYADELESSLGVDTSRGADSYDYLLTLDSNAVDSRMMWRANLTNGGSLWKTWDVFTGQLASGKDRSIVDVYIDADGADIRYPFWANPIPKFVNWMKLGDEQSTFSFVATLAQTADSVTGFTSKTAPGCDNVPGAVSGFGYCRHYTGTGGQQQSFSGIIYQLSNGLQGYYLAGGSNQRRVDHFVNVERDPRLIPSANDDISTQTGYGFTGGGANSPRLNVGSSCIGCHANGLSRANNNLRTWLDESPERLPKGAYGADAWLKDPATVKRVKELYKPNSHFKEVIENDRLPFLAAMGEIKNAMIWGEDKNVYVEPVIWTAEYAQLKKYNYKQTTSN